MFNKKQKFEPDLIDLVEYEKELLYQREHHITALPPYSILMRFDREWTASEMQYMRDNREKAQELYERLRIGQ